MDSIIPIIPIPQWEEEPSLEQDGSWAGRFRYLRQGYDGEPEVDIDVDFSRPPTREHIPVKINNVWYWKRNIQPIS